MWRSLDRFLLFALPRSLHHLLQFQQTSLDNQTTCIPQSHWRTDPQPMVYAPVVDDQRSRRTEDRENDSIKNYLRGRSIYVSLQWLTVLDGQPEMKGARSSILLPSIRTDWSINEWTAKTRCLPNWTSSTRIIIYTYCRILECGSLTAIFWRDRDLGRNLLPTDRSWLIACLAMVHQQLRSLGVCWA